MASLPAAETRPANGVPADVRCPTCQSRLVERQSASKRAAKVVAFGVFAAGSVAKTFKCLSCGYTW